MQLRYVRILILCILFAPPAVSQESTRAEKHAFYYHGKIIEDQGLAARNEKYGTYDYTLIVKALDAAGFTVHSEVRSAGTDVAKYANKQVAVITDLIESGVRPQDITLVGGSKGAVIAMTIQNELKNNAVRSVLLAGMFPTVVNSPSVQLYGHVLSIYDTGDTLVIDPVPLVKRSKDLVRFKEIAVEAGYGHGLLFKPYSDWIEPAIRWMREEVEPVAKTSDVHN